MSSDALAKVRAILVQAYGGNLDGSDRGPLVSTTYLAQLRDVVRDLAPAPADTATELAADATHAKLVEIADKLRAERVAHAETRAELDHWKGPGEPQASCTRGERKVLEAMAKMKHRTLAYVTKGSEFYPACRAELASRGGNPFAGVRASDWLKELDEERGDKP